MFLSVGASDGNPNPVKFAFLAGIGGKGVAPGHPQDSFSVGIARTQFSGAFIPFLRENLTSTLPPSLESAFGPDFSVAKARQASEQLHLRVGNHGRR